MNDFAVMIISHGRPECESISVMRECGYNGKIYIIIDTEDEKAPQYKKNWGEENVHVFEKKENFDVMDNYGGPNTVATFARNECFNLAKEKGIRFFLMLDDDLKSINYRYENDGKLKGAKATRINEVLEKSVELMKSTKVACMGYGLAMDYIGGLQRFEEYSKRSVMNAFLCDAKREFEFKGRYSEDMISPVEQNKIGRVTISHTGVQFNFEVWEEGKTRQDGGCQDVYKSMNSYLLRFYAVIAHPDCVIVRESKEGFDNTAKYNNAYPKIISERWKR